MISGYENLARATFRCTPTELPRVSALMRSPTAGWQGDPIEVFEQNNRKYVINGHHRVAAAKKAGIDVQYRSISLEEVKAYGYRDADHVTWSAVEVGRDFPFAARRERRGW
ncbi:ParB N-terminal domain-containing protein [Streptomyces sp. R41]|uniref:ParB N-terminal domain-containing protein n=1 Tax=Streptomyces sp. R41 TaxID=3238632 RepID=A0AB39RDZ3_9ACTN